MPRPLAACLLALLIAVPARGEEVTLTPGKLADLEKFVATHKGKVVVVDFWADYCVPCKKEFPNLVRLHQERAKDGLVCASVTVDEPEDREKALAFLKRQNATFFNMAFDEKYEVWQDKFGVAAVPMVLVYGKDGKLAKAFSVDDPKNQFQYSDVEKMIDTLLK